MVNLRNDQGPPHLALVHRLVLEAFVGPCPEGMEGCHNDGNRLNNDLSNLRWGTRSDNRDDARKHGTMSLGSRHPAAKLREEDIPAIRQLRDQGLFLWQIAERFGVSKSLIHLVLKGRNWKHV
jgi:hypothetical protein